MRACLIKKLRNIIKLQTVTDKSENSNKTRDKPKQNTANNCNIVLSKN